MSGQAPALSGSSKVRACTAGDGTRYLVALNNAAPPEIRNAVTAGILLWAVPWRGPGQAYFRLYDTTAGPVLMTDIFIGWSYSWGWPDAAAAARHVRRHTAEADLAEDYLRRHAAIMLEGPWGILAEQRGQARAVLHTVHGPQTSWYPGRNQALDAVAAHVRDTAASAGQLTGTSPAARAAAYAQAIAAADEAAAALRHHPPARPAAPGRFRRAARLLAFRRSR